MVERKELLSKLGTEVMSDILLDFASCYEEVNYCVNWMLVAPEERLAVVKAKIAGLYKIQDYIDWRHAGELENKLYDILGDIKSLNPSPEIGLELVVEFFRTDSHVFEICDSDMTGIIYGNDAAELFMEFGKQCEQKDFIIELLLELLKDDNYSVRGDILVHAGEFLSLTELKILFRKIQIELDDPCASYLRELSKQMRDKI
jgi:hypothetical protein